MIWVRKGIVWLLSLLLLVTLLGAAFSISFNRTLGQPEKVKTYLAESRIYDHFVAYVAKQASKSEGDDHSDTVLLSNTAVRAVAKTSFPSKLIQKGADTVIDANYAWLEGKTPKPRFIVDLSKAKETFAQKVGRIVKGYTATLPVCKGEQAARQKNADPLAATCRPKNLTPAQAGARTTARLSKTGDFLSNPVITARALDPKGNQKERPYYEKLSQLPAAYQSAKRSPFILGGLSVLFALGIVFIAVTRRKGLRRLGFVLALAGVVLVATKFSTDFALNKAKNSLFNNNVVGELQESLTDFVHRVISSMARTDLLSGIGLLVLAAVILISLFATRDKTPKPGKDDGSEGGGTDEPAGRMPLLKARKRFARPFGDSIMPLGARPGGPEPKEAETPQTEPEKPAEQPTKPKPKRRKKPRLIQ